MILLSVDYMAVLLICSWLLCMLMLQLLLQHMLLCIARLAKIALHSSETNQEQQAGSAQHENTHVQQCHGDDSRSSIELLQGGRIGRQCDQIR